MSHIQMPAPNQAILAQKEAIIAALCSALGHEKVIHHHKEILAYECDALTSYRCPPLAVILCDDSEDIAKAMKICCAYKLPIIPRGTGTSLAGGVLPTEDSVVISTARLTKVLEIDVESRFIRVETGITNIKVTEAVRDFGFFYAPDPSSQLACAIAGNIAMNSGGAHCLKYGVTTNNLLGVKMVTYEGEVLEIEGNATDGAGFDLLALICGSEGQLGIVTEARLKILPLPEGARPILIGYDNAETAGQCVANIIQAGFLPVAIEYMDRLSIQEIENFAHAGYPLCEALLIIEVEGSDDEIDFQLEKIKAIAAALNPVEMRVSQSEIESQLIWKGRKSAFGALGQLNDYICLDGTVPVSALPKALKEIGALSQKYQLQVANVFHAGDGNMHPLILYNANDPDEQERAENLGADILRACVDMGGCLSGEHGVGVEKRELMTTQFSAEDLEMQMQVKDVFDPHWLLNPAKVFPLHMSEKRRLAFTTQQGEGRI